MIGSRTFPTHWPLWLALAFLILGLTVNAENDPFLVQPQVQSHLENALARLLPPEQVLVQVTTDVITQQRRQLIEGETVMVQPEKKPQPPQIMPGFLPERQPEPNTPPQQSRQVYRMVDKNVLRLVRVHVSFDEALDVPLVSRAKLYVQDYLRAAYPNQSIVTFSTLPMRKIAKKEVEKRREPAQQPTPPPSGSQQKAQTDPLQQYLPWFLAALMLILLLFSSSRRAAEERAADKARREEMGRKPNLNFGFDSKGSLFNPKNLFGTGSRESEAAPRPDPSQSSRDYRKILLSRFLARSNAFRNYYRSLSADAQQELYQCLKGVAFDSFIRGLGMRPPRDEGIDPPEPNEIMAMHEKSFEEFVHAKEWNDKQFFGFLQDLNDEQLLSLVNHQNALGVCIMLRFMSARQSAFVLDHVEAGFRREILDAVNSLNQTSFAELASLERDVRETVQRMPHHLFGSQREDIEYWGSVLSESENQDGILSDIQQTNPGIYPNLKKFKFRLEDAVSLPNTLMQRVIAEVDNEELSMALATIAADLVDIFLDVVSPKRKEILEFQIASSRTASKEELNWARQNLTKRFREVLS